MLEPTLKTLKINSNSILVDKIINQKPGVAERMLYELKMALEKVNNPADILILHKTGKFNPIIPLKRLDPGKLQFDAMESRFFDQRINEMNKAQKQVNLEKHLLPFEEFKLEQEEMLHRQREEDIIKENKIKEEMRKIQLNKLQRNMAFLENWNEKGKENWEKNQKITKDRIKKDEDFAAKTQERKNIKLQSIHDQNKKEILEGIASFESNLKKMGIESPEGEKKASSMDKSHTMFSASATMLRIKEKKMVSDFLRKERDKRRRKMIVDQAKAQREIEVQKRQELLLDKLNQQSRQERELTYEIWRAEQGKEIIKENRVLREGKYKQKREQCVLSAKYKEEEMLHVLREEFAMDLEAKRLRLGELQIQEKKETRKFNYNLMKGIINEMFDISDLLFSHQQDQDAFEFTPNFFSEIVKLFTNSKALIPYRTIRNPISTDILTLEYEDNEKESIDYLSLQELTDYTEGRGLWTPVHKGECPENPELDDKYTPKIPINNFYLGNLTRFLIMKSYNQEKQVESSKSSTNYLPLKLSILGYDFSGKKTLISYMQQKYGIEPIFIDQLIEEALDRANEHLNKLEETPKKNPMEIPLRAQDKELLNLSLEIRDFTVTGKRIPDIYYIKLILLRIKQLFPSMNFSQFVDFYQEKPYNAPKTHTPHRDSVIGVAPLTKEEIFVQNLMSHSHKFTKGWVLYDFPHTYEQAKLLEEHLTGFLPKDERPLLLYEEKLKVAAILAKANPVTVIKRKLIPSGLDCCFLVKTSKEECLRRALGRKHDGLTKVNYHLDDIIPPTDNAPLIERLENRRDIRDNELVLVDKLNAFDSNSNSLKDWFQNFGIEELGLESWQEIEYQKDPVLNFEAVSKISERILEFKEKMIENELDSRRKLADEEQRVLEEAKLQEEKDKELNFIDVEEIKQDIQKIQKGNSMEKDLLKVEQIGIFCFIIFNLFHKYFFLYILIFLCLYFLGLLMSFWQNIESFYLTQTKEVFKNMRQQRELISMRLAEIQRHFLETLQKKDQKFVIF